MRPILITLAAFGTIALAPTAMARERLTGEQELAKALDGRVAGKPQDCLPITSTRDSQVIDRTAILYRDGPVIWVNRPKDATALNSDDVQVVKLHIDQLCRIDTIEMHDRTSHMMTGFVVLEDFVPYTKAPAAAH